ncbi:MAG: hypothetical protein K6A80_10855 [Saccharofermentans sp.]|nr:hypothetical protein [Saccharofermentans sp.]
MDEIEIKLDEADKNAAADDARMPHGEVFGKLKEQLNNQCESARNKGKI